MRNVCAVVVLVIISTCVALPAPARADVLFNNFHPVNNGYLGNTGWTVSNGIDLMVHLEQAAVFTVPAGDHFLNSIELALGHLFGPNVVHVTLRADANNAPGAAIQTVTVVDQINPMPTEPKNNFPPVVANFGGTSVLQGGTNYWVSLSSDTSVPNSWLAWNYNTTGDLGLRAQRTDGGPWSTHTGDPRGAFRVNGTPVPEPACAAAMLVATLGLTLRRRPRTRAA